MELPGSLGATAFPFPWDLCGAGVESGPKFKGRVPVCHPQLSPPTGYKEAEGWRQLFLPLQGSIVTTSCPGLKGRVLCREPLQLTSPGSQRAFLWLPSGAFLSLLCILLSPRSLS